MKARRILLSTLMVFLSLDAAVIDEQDSASKIVQKGCKSLRFNKNPETFNYGIVLGFSHGTADAYREQLLQSGAIAKKKRSLSLAAMARSACKAAMTDESEDRFYDVFKRDVIAHVVQEFDGEVSVSKKRKSSNPGIESFFEEN